MKVTFYQGMAERLSLYLFCTFSVIEEQVSFSLNIFHKPFSFVLFSKTNCPPKQIVATHKNSKHNIF